jgi:hypothetical protein
MEGVDIAAAIDLAALRSAIEKGDPEILAGLYAPDATITIVDRDHPPGQPLEISGLEAITAFHREISLRPITHTVDQAFEANDRIAFTQRCLYPNGSAVLCMTMLELEQGRISRQLCVQAWDEA